MERDLTRGVSDHWNTFKLPSLKAEDLSEHRAANNGATERKAGWKENKVMHVGVLVGWRSCRWRLRLAAVWHATHTNATFACAKEVVCWWGAVRPPLLGVCGHSGSDLFKCSWKLLTACFLKSVSFSRLLFVCETQGGLRGRCGSHSCVTRFLASMFALLFPYSGCIWIEPSLESGGWFWRSLKIFSGWGTCKHSHDILDVGNIFQICVAASECLSTLGAVKWTHR